MQLSAIGDLCSMPDFTYPVQTKGNRNMEIEIPQFPSWHVRYTELCNRTTLFVMQCSHSGDF